MKKQFEILYEDDDILVVNKGAGLLTVADRFDHKSDNLSDLLKRKYEEVFTVHRLDRDTSGVIVFARNAEAHRVLSAQFLNGEVEKYYLSLVHGIPAQPEGIIENNLVESNVVKGKMVIHKKGKLSKSKYTVIQTFNQYAILKIRIFTGRMHQIRVHMNSIGNPIVADSKYGVGDSFFLSSIKRRKFNIGKDTTERPLLARQALHSHELNIKHPSSGEKMQMIAELPKDMRATIQQLEKWNA